jgi:hypothetical protein
LAQSSSRTSIGTTRDGGYEKFKAEREAREREQREALDEIVREQEEARKLVEANRLESRDLNALGSDSDDSEYDNPFRNDPRKKSTKKRKRRRKKSSAEDYGNRTLGRACMYGPNGEVVFRPRGSRCKGDPPPAAPAANAAGASRSGAPESGDVTRKARQDPKKQKLSAGKCMYGADGKLIYASRGADCRR